MDREERIYRPSINLERRRCQEVLRNLSRQVSRKWSSTTEVSSKYRATRNQIQEQKLDRSIRCRKAIKEAGAFSIDPLGIEELSGLRYEKGLGSSTDSQLSRRRRGGVEPAFQNSFPRGEKHRHECNPTCNSTNDPINTIISQLKF